MDYQGNSSSGQWRARQPARAAARYDSLSISEGEEKKIRRGVSWMGHGALKYRRRVGRRAFSFSLETTGRTGQKRATNRGPARVMPVPARDQRENSGAEHEFRLVLIRSLRFQCGIAARAMPLKDCFPGVWKDE